MPAFFALWSLVEIGGCTDEDESADDSSNFPLWINLADGVGAQPDTLGWAYGELLQVARAQFGDTAVVTNTTCLLSNPGGLVSDLHACGAVGHSEGDGTWFCRDDGCQPSEAAKVAAAGQWMIDSPAAIGNVNFSGDTLTGVMWTYAYFSPEYQLAPCAALPDDAPADRVLLALVSEDETERTVLVDGVTEDFCDFE